MPVQCIADANVLFALLTEGHAHRSVAFDWWQTCGDKQVGLCLPVRMAVLRLLTNSTVMGSGVLRPAQAWDAMAELIADPRITPIELVPTEHAALWRTHILRREPTPNLWTDAWLAALAQGLGCEMVTFDKGFRSFVGLQLRLLLPMPLPITPVGRKP